MANIVLEDPRIDLRLDGVNFLKWLIDNHPERVDYYIKHPKFAQLRLF